MPNGIASCFTVCSRLVLNLVGWLCAQSIQKLRHLRHLCMNTTQYITSPILYSPLNAINNHTNPAIPFPRYYYTLPQCAGLQNVLQSIKRNQ
jgi:hypothetical protein